MRIEINEIRAFPKEIPSKPMFAKELNPHFTDEEEFHFAKELSPRF